MDRAPCSGRSMGMAWAQAAALAFLLGGCAGGAQGGANTPEVDLEQQGESPQGVRALTAEGDDGRSSGNGAAHRKAAPLPAAFSSLGKECPSAPQATTPLTPQTICGRDNRVAALWQFSHGPAPAVPEPVIQRRPTPSAPTMGGVSAARVHVDGEHLWIASACMMCRVPSESLWIGDLSLVSDEQIGQVQLQMGLPQKPALRDEKAWQAALAKSTPGD
jgi:hypothetical protein